MYFNWVYLISNILIASSFKVNLEGKRGLNISKFSATPQRQVFWPKDQLRWSRALSAYIAPLAAGSSHPLNSWPRCRRRKGWHNTRNVKETEEKKTCISFMKLWEEDSLQILSYWIICIQIILLLGGANNNTSSNWKNPSAGVAAKRIHSASEGNWCFNDARTWKVFHPSMWDIAAFCVQYPFDDVVQMYCNLKNSFEWKGSKIQWFHDKNWQCLY